MSTKEPTLEVIKDLVELMDYATLWRWKTAIDERIRKERERGIKENLCGKIRELLRKVGYEITYDREDQHRCVLNFRDRRLFEKAKEKFGEDDAEWIATSSVTFDKHKGSIEANFVSPLEKFCELYLDECCLKGDNLCRIHADPEYPKIGLEIKGADFEQFQQALYDFLNCTK